ncbi:MAG: hypothetical protein EBY89_05375, partial [Actinobacteria bacterium]|nr:hypothetical protein [Actinomycetota bacterium]
MVPRAQHLGHDPPAELGRPGELWFFEQPGGAEALRHRRGAGMVMSPQPIFDSFERSGAPRPLFLLSPGGKRFDQAFANRLSELDGFSLLCGRYEGVDQRVREHLVDAEVSVGDVVLSGGEVAACLIIEAVVRLVPGAMGNAESPLTESFGATGLLEEPQYTRPADFRGWSVPDVLRGGDHALVA